MYLATFNSQQLPQSPSLPWRRQQRDMKREIFLKCDFYLFKISLTQTTALQGNIKVKLAKYCMCNTVQSYLT